MRLLLLLVGLLYSVPVFSAPGGSGPEDEKKKHNVNYHIVGESRVQFIRFFQEAMERPKFDYPSLVRNWLPQFGGLPYGASNEACSANKTLVNFETFDCVTFVETFWALSYTVHQYKTGKENDTDPFIPFVRNLERIRYFGGRNCGIEERIHYWTQGLIQMQKQGLMVNIAVANGEPFTKKISYLSHINARSYSPSRLARTKELEKILNNTPRFYYPQESVVSAYLPLAQDGDIISFAAGQDGLDVTHTGIITVVDGELKITHASSLYDKLVVEQDLMTYLSRKSNCPGIFIYRPVFK